VFDRDRITASRRRLVWGGVLFGFAGAIESWANIPVLVVTARCLPRTRRTLAFVAGVAAGFIVPVLPFAVLAPHRFYQSLITAQLGHRAASLRISIWVRLQEMTGLSHVVLPARANLLITRVFLYPQSTIFLTLVILLLLSVGSMAVVIFVTRRPPPPLDAFAVVSMLLIGLVFLLPSQFHYHFPAFLAPFLGMAIGLPLSRLTMLGQPAPASPWRGLAGAVTAAAAAVLVVLTIFQVRAEGQVKALLAPTGPVSIAAFARHIPAGSCVATDEVSLLIVADRFVTSVPGCSPMLDGTGTDLALSAGGTPATGAARNPAVVAAWQQEFAHARYAWFSVYNSRRIAWSPALRAYFTSHFVPVMRDPRGDILYRRRAG